VIAVLPNTTLRVELPNGHRILGYVSGSMRRASLRLAVGDRVKVILSPYDLSKGCIVGKTG
jgi:translation initiation factor IF-1